jgi:hypothetical protein
MCERHGRLKTCEYQGDVMLAQLGKKALANSESDAKLELHNDIGVVAMGVLAGEE